MCGLSRVFRCRSANSEAVCELKCRGVCAVEPFAELDDEALAAFREKSPLPLVESDRSGAALLVTRLELPGSAWTDGRGRRFPGCAGKRPFEALRRGAGRFQEE